jgi:hypothetical protein
MNQGKNLSSKVEGSYSSSFPFITTQKLYEELRGKSYMESRAIPPGKIDTLQNTLHKSPQVVKC